MNLESLKICLLYYLSILYVTQFILCSQDRSLDFHALCALYAVTGIVILLFVPDLSF